MTEPLERLATEVRKLTPVELDELLRWLSDYQSVSQRTEVAAGPRIDWSSHFADIEQAWGDTPPLDKNVVLEMRQEERD